MARIRTVPLLLIGACSLAVLVPLVLIALRKQGVIQTVAVVPPVAPGLAPTVLPDIRTFRLTDQHGKPFGSEDLRGKVVLLYFGYTFCPDICPTELGYVSRVMRALGPDGDRVVPVFITVDPERDSQEVVAGYVPLFDKRMVGLRGTPDEVAVVAKAYGVFHQKTTVVSQQAGYYLIDHSSTIFVLDPQGRVADTLDSDSPMAATVARIKRLF